MLKLSFFLSVFFVSLCRELRIMATKLWGPAFWQSLGATALGYHLNDDTTLDLKIKHYKTFFQSLKYVLPCGYCRDSYGTYYKKLNIEKYMRSKKQWSMIRFVYDLKECVNAKLRKQEKALFKERLETLTPTQKQDKACLRRLKKRIFTTKRTPTFSAYLKRVLRMIPNTCSNQIGSCVKNKLGTKQEFFKLAPLKTVNKKSKKGIIKTA